MAHVAKFTRGSVGTLSRHYERAKSEITNEYIKFKNQDIDTTKTYLNYNLAPKRNQLEFIKQRCDEANCLKRKDVNVMCDWVITAPKNFPADQHRLLFEESYKFLINRYGDEKNVISAYVHNDETTPHMHFSFVPVAFDSKKNRETVSAKLILNKLDLKKFHPDLEKHLSKVFGYEIGIINEVTKDGNHSIEELKKQSAVERLKVANKEAEQIIGSAKKTIASNLSQIQDELKQAELKRSEMLENANLEVLTIKDKLLPLQIEYDALKAFIEQSKKDSDISLMYPDYAQINKKGIINKQEYVTVPKKEWEARHVSFYESNALEKERQALEKGIKEFHKTEPVKKIKNLEKELLEVRQLNKDLEQELYEINEKIREVFKVFEKNPKLEKAFNESKESLRRSNSKSYEMYDDEMDR